METLKILDKCRLQANLSRVPLGYSEAQSPMPNDRGAETTISVFDVASQDIGRQTA
jgi:hypothetical protein